MATVLRPLSLPLIFVVILSVVQSRQPVFSISINQAHSESRTQREIKINVLLKNISNHDIVIPRSNAKDQGEFHYEVHVSDAQGKLIATKRQNTGVKDGDDLQSLTMETAVTFTLKPGDSLDDGIVLSDLYDFVKPGNYTIQIQRHDDVSDKMIKSNQITVTVAP
jgi:hypothetical protein